MVKIVIHVQHKALNFNNEGQISLRGDTNKKNRKHVSKNIGCNVLVVKNRVHFIQFRVFLKVRVYPELNLN
jgi:hypothetical protein